jgi:hypothetical protein
MIWNSKCLATVPAKIGRTRRSRKLSIASAPSSFGKKRPSKCT